MVTEYETAETHRYIYDHYDEPGGLLSSMRVHPVDEVGPGGAHHVYKVTGEGFETVITFQKGPRHGPDMQPGLLEPVLVSILLDRLRAFQAGDFACRENAIAITKLEEALMWMRERARNRAMRGVLGTYQK